MPLKVTLNWYKSTSDADGPDAKREQLCGRKQEVDLGNRGVSPKNYDTIRPALSVPAHKRCRFVAVLCAGGRLWRSASFSCKIISNCSAALLVRS